MKKSIKKFGKLSLKKETISNLKSAKGGQVWTWSRGNCTAACTDGCGGGSLGACTMWNCTDPGCTGDCATNFCDTDFMCTTVANSVKCGGNKR